MSYDQDLAEPLQAVEDATWLLKPEYEACKRALVEYQAGRAIRFAMLVDIVAQPDQDISTAWKANIDLFPVSLGQLKETLLLEGGDQHLELNDWYNRESRIYDALKAEKFLQARESLIARKVLLTEATKTLNELTDQFFKENGELNAKMVEAASKTKKMGDIFLTGATAFTGLGAAITGSLLLAIISASCASAKFLGDQYQTSRETLKEKKENNAQLTQIRNALGDLIKGNQEEEVRSIVDEATIESVAGSEDFSKFLEDLIEKWKKVHVDPAEAAAKEFGESLRKGIGDHSDKRVEEITKIKFLAEQRDEIFGIMESVESTALIPFETAMNELLREGDKAEEIRDKLRETREEMQKLKEKADSDLTESRADAESLAQLLTFE